MKNVKEQGEHLKIKITMEQINRRSEKIKLK